MSRKMCRGITHPVRGAAKITFLISNEQQRRVDLDQAVSFLEAMGLAQGCADFAVVAATVLKIAPSELH